MTADDPTAFAPVGAVIEEGPAAVGVGHDFWAAGREVGPVCGEKFAHCGFVGFSSVAAWSDFLLIE